MTKQKRNNQQYYNRILILMLDYSLNDLQAALEEREKSSYLLRDTRDHCIHSPPLVSFHLAWNIIGLFT